jgi:DNA repair exonuclease SbcCD ATPase subunit
MKEERDRGSKLAKDRIGLLQTRTQTLEEELQKLRDDVVKGDKRNKDLAEEYEKLRLKLKQYHQKRKQYGELEEKVCKNCQKMFTEYENFNWSCRTHPSEYSSEMYWCCGKPGRDAPGCRISKHESKDEEEEKLASEKDENDRIRLASVQCPVRLI